MNDKQFMIFSSKIVFVKEYCSSSISIGFLLSNACFFCFLSTLLDFENILKAMKYRWPCHALAILLLSTIEENWYSKLPILYATNV